MSVMEVDSEDVVRLMLQYMKEHNLTATLKQLQAESKVCLDTVDNLDNLSSDINHGRWEAVIPQVTEFSIAKKVLPVLFLHCLSRCYTVSCLFLLGVWLGAAAEYSGGPV
jgi:WD40 repeat-containing protein SMU1